MPQNVPNFALPGLLHISRPLLEALLARPPTSCACQLPPSCGCAAPGCGCPTPPTPVPPVNILPEFSFVVQNRKDGYYYEVYLDRTSPGDDLTLQMTMVSSVMPALYVLPILPDISGEKAWLLFIDDTNGDGVVALIAEPFIPQAPVIKNRQDGTPWLLRISVVDGEPTIISDKYTS